MSEIKVPREMIKAGFAEINQCERQGNPPAYATFLEAALRWLSENPQVPTDAQIDELIDSMPALTRTSARIVLEAWQRRMFLAPEPEIPKEIDDLLWDDTDKGPYYVEHNKAAIEAYRRGQRSKP